MASATGEFSSILDPSCAAPSIVDAAGTGCWSAGDPFTGIQNVPYWSSSFTTTLPAFPANAAYNADLSSVSVNANNGGNAFRVWAVRNGRGGQ